MNTNSLLLTLQNIIREVFALFLTLKLPSNARKVDMDPQPANTDSCKTNKPYFWSVLSY